MPNGRIHNTATLATGAVFVSGMAYFGFPAQETLAAAIGFLVTLFVNPDLDLNTRFPRTKPHKWLWWVFWFPYSRLIGHRSFFSHLPVLGTIIRIGYITTFLSVLAIVVFQQFDVPNVLMFVVVAMIVSDTIHFVLDTL